MNDVSSDSALLAPNRDQAQHDFVRQKERLEDAAVVVGRLAHDFGNVLTSILGFAELTMRQIGPHSEVAPYVAELHQAAQQGAQFVSDLRLFSRRRSVQPQPTSLLELAAAEEARLRPTWVPGCELRVSLPSNLPAIAIDAEPLRQVIGRLLENAHEACAGTESLVTLTARLVTLTESDSRQVLGNAAAGPHVEITIADNGKGLGTVARQYLFRELFFSTKPRHQGLGLAIVYGILHAYRGGLRLDPGPEGGTVVRVVLPVAAVGTPSSRGPALVSSFR